MTEKYTLEDLMRMTQNNATARLVLRHSINPDLSYGEFAAAVEEAIDLVADRMSANPKYRQNRSEDELSIDLVDHLCSMGFGASHDTMHGGHSDIVVLGRGKYSWLGEAKIHKDYDWLLKGYNQLTTRYASGVATNSRGGMVIYSYRPRIDQMMDRWKDRLTSEFSDVRVQNDARYAAFSSIQQSQRTGADYTVRHLAICFHFDPKDA